MRRPARSLTALTLSAALLSACSDRLPTDVTVAAPSPATAAAVCSGNVQLGSQAAVNAFTCTQITGDLTIAHTVNGANTDITSLVPLAGLTSVGGTLRIFRNPGLMSLTGLQSLVSLGGALEIEGNNVLGSISALSGLGAIGDRLFIRTNPSLVSLVGLDNVTTVGQNVLIEGTGITTLAGLGGLRSVGPMFGIQFNPSLVSLAGLGLTSYPGWMTIRDNDALTSLQGLDSLGSVSRLDVNENDALVSISALSNLATADVLQIQRNTLLGSLSGLENVTAITGTLDVDGNASLKSIAALSGLTSAGALRFSFNDSLTSLTGIENVSSLGSLSVIGSDVSSLPDIGKVTSMSGTLLLQSNSKLTSVAGLGAVQSVGGDVSIRDNPVLATLAGMNNVTAVGGFLTIGNNAVLPTLSGLDRLASVGQDLRIEQGAALVSVAGLGRLTSVGGSLVIRQTPALVSLAAFSALATVGSGMYVEDNVALVNFSGLDNLASVGREMIVERNASLASFTGLTRLATIGTSGHQLRIAGNPSLISLAGMSSLTTMPGQFTIAGNASLTSLAGLEAIGSVGSLYVQNNGSLATLAGIQNLSRVENNLDISGNPVLSTCSCGLAALISGGVFSGVGSSVVIANNSPTGQCNSTSAVLAAPCAANRSPVANAGADQIVECSGALSSVSLDGSASMDPDGDALSFTWTRNGTVVATGVTPVASLGVGSHAISLMVSDGNGGTSSDDVQITIADTRAPVITLAGSNPMTLQLGAAYQESGASATDACAGNLSSAIVIDASAVNTNTAGTYTVTYRVSDPSGNVATATRTVHVVAAPALPVITVGAAPRILKSDRTLKNVALGQLKLSVKDPSDPTLTASRVVIAAVWSDEPAMGGSDKSKVDIVIATDCRSVKVRAERREPGNGRVYTIQLSVTNVHGATGTATYKVFVPVRAAMPAVDDGASAGHTVPGTCGG